MRTSAHQVLAELCRTVPAAVTCERDLSSENGIEASNTFATRFHRRRVQTFSSESFSDSGFDLMSFITILSSMKFALIFSKAASLTMIPRRTTAFRRFPLMENTYVAT